MGIVAEEWRRLPDAPYEVSNQGRVQSLPRRVFCRAGKTRLLPGKMLKPMLRRDGYFTVSITKERETKKTPIHLLVAEVFIGPRKAGIEVNHKDGDKRNNRLSNLEYVTRSGNMRHAFATGLFARRGVYEIRPLTGVQVAEIRALYKTGRFTRRQLAKCFGISDCRAVRLIAGKCSA